jgi:hypothetical protein
LNGTPQTAQGPLEEGLAGGQLPAGEPFVHQILQGRAQHYRPQDGHAQLAAGEGTGGQVAGADAGGRDEKARADEGQQPQEPGCSSLGLRGFLLGRLAMHGLGEGTPPVSGWRCPPAFMTQNDSSWAE